MQNKFIAVIISAFICFSAGFAGEKNEEEENLDLQGLGASISLVISAWDFIMSMLEPDSLSNTEMNEGSLISSNDLWEYFPAKDLTASFDESWAETFPDFP